MGRVLRTQKTQMLCLSVRAKGDPTGIVKAGNRVHRRSARGVLHQNGSARQALDPSAGDGGTLPKRAKLEGVMRARGD